MSKGVGIDSRWGITAVRVAMGLIVAVAGIQKWVAGVGGVAAAFGRWGIPFPSLAAPLVAMIETVGGILLVLGLGTRCSASSSRSSSRSRRSGWSSASWGGVTRSSPSCCWRVGSCSS